MRRLAGLAFVGLLPVSANAGVIVLNQQGYTPEAVKEVLIVHAPKPDGALRVLDLSSGKPLMRLEAHAAARDPWADQPVWRLDVSALKSGRYRIEGAGMRSPVLHVAHDVYRPLLRLLLRSYYLQRCGQAVADRETGLGHAACHQRDGRIAHADRWHAAGTRVDAHGGWHDAGDFGKYIATASVTVARLLDAFEQDARLRGDGWLHIPESGNGLPDMLDEIAVELDWMLRMQRPDGAVYRKLSGKRWPPHGSPVGDRQPRFLFAPASSDTAKFAAAMAMAARIYLPFDHARAARYRHAALAAWDSLLGIKKQEVAWHEGDDSGSGKYLYSAIDNEETLRTDQDDRFWAAVELFRLTGEARFARAIRRYAPAVRYTYFGWKNPAPLGVVHYLMLSDVDHALAARLRRLLLARASSLLQRSRDNPYGLADTRFIWGSNKVAAEHGNTLLAAYRLSGNRDYLTAAQWQADFLLGRNPFGRSFVTGVGEVSVRHPHMRWAEHAPGFLVGGPNQGAQDGVAPRGRGVYSYADDARSYATNEPAIDYNAALIGLLSGLSLHAGGG
ncbi:MAG: glycosyl hydrolase family 5 [Zetaproteobacteria bacterium]|nr:MAG: glycosyl hydrolase family 5 [Zetaproteobacteria bacterium]